MNCRSHSIISEWNLLCGNSWAPQLVYTGFFVGLLIGTTAFGAFADKYGTSLTLALTIWTRASVHVGRHSWHVGMVSIWQKWHSVPGATWHFDIVADSTCAANNSSLLANAMGAPIILTAV